jgi:RNA recognition motif-containing protein
MSTEENIEHTIFVRNINFATTGEQLGAAFRKYGEVKNVRIITRIQDEEQVSRGFGFVEFQTAEGFNAAISATEPLIVDDREIFIRASRPVQKRDTAFIRGIPEDTTEEDIKEAFSKYNPVSVRIKFVDNGDRKGFGFITFDTEEHQTAAVEENKEIELKGGTSTIRFARPPRRGSGGRRYRGFRRNERPTRAEPAGRPPRDDQPRTRQGGRRPGADRFIYLPDDD